MIAANNRQRAAPRRASGKVRLALLLVLSIQALIGNAAQSVVERPLRLVVPFPPGGGLDLTARLLTPHLSQALAKPIVVDNQDDIILMPGEVDFLVNTFDTRAKIFPAGGHLGNLQQKETTTYIVNWFKQ